MPILKHSPFTYAEIEEIRLEALEAIKENITGYLFIGSINEALRYGYDKESDGGVVFKRFFRVYEDCLDVQVDEFGYVI